MASCFDRVKARIADGVFDRAQHRAVQKTALKDAGLTAADIEEVILVGGMTFRMPRVQARVCSSFSKNRRTKVSIPTKWSPSARRCKARCFRAK